MGALKYVIWSCTRVTLPASTIGCQGPPVPIIMGAFGSRASGTENFLSTSNWLDAPPSQLVRVSSVKCPKIWGSISPRDRSACIVIELGPAMEGGVCAHPVPRDSKQASKRNRRHPAPLHSPSRTPLRPSHCPILLAVFLIRYIAGSREASAKVTFLRRRWSSAHGTVRTSASERTGRVATSAP